MATYTPVCTLHNKFIKHLTPIVSRTIVTSKRQYLIEYFNKHYFTEHPNKQRQYLFECFNTYNFTEHPK